MAGGRPAKHKKIHDLHGGLGKRKIREPLAVLPGIPEPPTSVRASKDALEAWEFVIAELSVIEGLLARADRFALTALCLNVANLESAARSIKEHGTEFEEPITDSEGAVLGYKIVRNPAVETLDKASKQIRQFCEIFGLSPSARMRLGSHGKEKKDELEDFLSTKRTGEEDTIQ